ncbi:YitT family protein [Listeria grandensis]|uniref:YitT family protein n=1 Tax=Listeria grandensis TaxID=1494963 RepID=A0A7X1CPZ2_9LIST|nr:YitT family protein [Listeria grandensis]MBC1475327.1 YitT family protein [Listeria grandensis]MBC1936491.1 YitT family protein [Listeria grandensis]
MKYLVKQFLLVAVSIALIGVSINLFLAPHHIAAGGVTGIGILVEQALGIPLALTVLVLNVVMLILAFLFLGRAVFVRSFLGSLLLPLSLAIIPETMLAQDRLLSVIFGSMIFAIGVAILYRIEASSGGTTIPPLILKKYFNLNTSLGLFLVDAIIVIFNIFVFGVDEFLFAILSLILVAIIMNYLETGLKKRKAVMIMSDDKIEEIKAGLLEEMGRGVTVFSVSGGFTGSEKTMLMVVLETREYQLALKMINSIDKKSFVIAYTVSEVHGLGFSYHTIE